MRIFIQQVRTIAASAMLLLLFTLGCGPGGSDGSPLQTLSPTDFNTYKAKIIEAVGGVGCACRNLCNMMTVLPPTPPGEEPLKHECYEKSPKQRVFLVDPTDNVSKECAIGCFCKCDVPFGQTVTCVMFDSLIGWPSPVDGKLWGQVPD